MTVERLAHAAVGHGVEVGGGLIEDDHGGVAQHGVYSSVPRKAVANICTIIYLFVRLCEKK